MAYSWVKKVTELYDSHPIQTTADGNSGLRAVSRLFFGTQIHHQLLRLLALCGMLVHRGHLNTMVGADYYKLLDNLGVKLL